MISQKFEAFSSFILYRTYIIKEKKDKDDRCSVRKMGGEAFDLRIFCKRSKQNLKKISRQKTIENYWTGNILSCRIVLKSVRKVTQILSVYVSNAFH